MKYKFSGYLLIIFLALTGISFSFQNNEADKITGVWLTEKEKAKVKIYSCDDNEYCGKVIWTKNNAEGNPRKLDKNNPDPDKRNRTILGINILKDLEYNQSEDIWEGGKIYDPEKGKKYNCWAELVNPDKLKLRGYVGVSLLGRSTYWKRVNN